MDGILNVLKPTDMTSFDVVGYLRGVLKIKKIGHTGTLDPAAVGVLPICIGRATRAIEYMTEKDKLYRAELTLGIETDTQDATGTVTATHDVKASDEQLIEAIEGFTGKIRQVPPMYSAVKVNGVRLYDLAREGITIERKAREIEIYSISVLRINRSIPSRPTVIFDVACSKGTYIRTLCADIGEKLGCGGHMSFLIRLKAGSFEISSALTVEEIGELSRNGCLQGKLTAVDKVFENFDRLTLDEVNTKKFLNGIYVKLPETACKKEQLVRVYSNPDSFIALGEVVKKDEALFLKSKKIF